MRSFKLAEFDRESGCREIRVQGELDLAVADRLQECLERVGSGHVAILIDLERCEFIDSTGIALILRTHNLMAEQGRRLAVCAPSEQVLRVLSITGLTENGLVFEKVEEALADFQTA